MALIFDTNALSAFVDGDASLHQAIEAETDLAVPTVVLGEYLYGIRQSRHRSRYESWLRANLPLLEVLPIGSHTAEYYAEIRRELKTAGHPIPTNDLWIAAVAREHAAPVVSRDRHFSAVRSLRVVT